jgi:hypothetical protein
MTNEQLQAVVDAENKRLNDVSMGKAADHSRRIAVLTYEKQRIDKEIAEHQKAIAALPFDTVTVDTLVNGFHPTTQP